MYQEIKSLLLSKNNNQHLFISCFITIIILPVCGNTIQYEVGVTLQVSVPQTIPFDDRTFLSYTPEMTR